MMKTKLFLALTALLVATLACGLPANNVLFKDDFANCDSGWATQRDSDGITDCENGAYRMLVDTDNFFFWTAPGEQYEGDVSVQAEFTKTDGPEMSDIGLICRYNADLDNFYFMTMSFDGYAAIGLWEGNDYTLLAETYDNNFGSESQMHTLQADCIGSAMSLTVDGVRVVTINDSTLTSGDAGFIVGTYDTPGLDVLFDNFTVTAP